MASRSDADTRPDHPEPGENVPIGLVLGGGSLIHQVGRELRTAIESGLAPLGVTAQQGALLLQSARGETSPNRLAALLGTDTAGMTRLLDRLEAKGLIRRGKNPGDRRSIVVELTEQGGALVPRLAPVFGRVSFRLLAGFSEQEVHQVTGMLHRMIENLRPPGPAGTDPGAPGRGA
jgi:DNA-binding MarR family transcriptional regulator